MQIILIIEKLLKETNSINDLDVRIFYKDFNRISVRFECIITYVGLGFWE